MLKSIVNKLLDAFVSKDWRHCFHGGRMVMRRRLPGRWEYRNMTVEELDDALMEQAIK